MVMGLPPVLSICRRTEKSKGRSLLTFIAAILYSIGQERLR